MTKAVVVLTSKSVASILEEGGSSAWRLDRNNARQCPYAVCVRNAHSKWNEGTESHHTGFLVGRITDVVETKTDDETVRFLLQFSDYALIDLPNAWTGDRNPVKYEDLERIGINPNDLEWQPMPKVSAHPAENKVASVALSKSPNGGLTMDQAKRGLAITFGVKPDAIEILIRG